MASSDERWMYRCIELALEAKRVGNTPVGSLVVIEERLIAEAEEEVPVSPDRFAHAEILAVKRASTQLGRKSFPEATLYTTAEPCFLCSYAIRETRIGLVVIGTRTPHVGGASSQYPLLSASDIVPWGEPPTIIWGVLHDECSALRSRVPKQTGSQV